MNSLRIFLGLDYHSHFIRVCVMAEDGQVLANRDCPNDVAALQALAQRYGTRIFAALEACGGTAHLAEALGELPGWTVNLAHAAYVARLKKGLDKTDKQDAEVLADLLRVGYLPRVWLPPAPLRDWRVVVRHRQQLVTQRTQAKLRVTALLREARRVAPEQIRPWTRAWLAWAARGEGLGENARWLMGRHLAEIERLARELRVVQQRLAVWAQGDAFVQRLLTYRGVGLVTAATLRVEIGDIDRFRTGKQLSRYFGVTPRNVSSGQRQADAGLINAGNPQVRALLVQLAHRLPRTEPRWHALAQGMRRRGKPGSVVAAAVANRWLRWLHYDLTRAPQAPIAA